MLRAAPEMATGLGLDTGERAFLKSRLGDASPAGKMGPYQPLLDHLPQLRQIDRGQLQGRERAWLDTVLWLGERMSEAATVPLWRHRRLQLSDPLCAVAADRRLPVGPRFPRQPAPDRDARGRAGLCHPARGIRPRDQPGGGPRPHRRRPRRGPPSYILDKALTQTRTLREERGAESSLVRSLVRRTRERNIAGDWGTQAAAIVDGRLAAALDRQIGLLTEMRRGADRDPAAGRLPDGERFYALALRFHTSTSLSPEEAHQIGLRQVEEIQRRGRPAAAPRRPDPGQRRRAAHRAGRQQRWLYPNTDAGREQLIADLNRQMEAVRARMPEYFNTIPRSPMEVEEGTAGDRAGAPRGYAQGPSLDGSRPGAFYINLRDTGMWPRWALPTSPITRASPAISGRARPCSRTRRSPAPPQYRHSRLRRGLGLYAEQLADEIGEVCRLPAGDREAAELRTAPRGW